MMNKHRINQTLGAWAMTLGTLLLFTGCAGYRLGTMLPGDIKTVFVPTFVNQTAEPLLEVDTTQAMIRELQRDGSLKVVRTEAEADAVLHVVLKGFTLDPVAFRSDIRSAAQEYRMIIDASMVMRRTTDQSVVVESPLIRGDYVFDVVGDLSSSKLLALPDASDDLARRLVQRVVEYL